MKTLAPSLLGLALLAGCGPAAPPPAPPAPPPAATPEGGSAYPLATCVVSDEKLGSMGDPVVIRHEGTEVRLCCAACEKEFRKDPAKYVAKIAAAKKAK